MNNDFNDHGSPRMPECIFRAWKVNPKTGERMYAKHYGLRAWPIPVDPTKK